MKYYQSVPGIRLLLLLGSLLIAGAALGQDDADAADFSQAELDQMLAPVALYPDTVLSHLLIAATYPLEVVMAERWTRANPDLTGQVAVEAVDDQTWDPSVKALVAFPDLLRRMSEDLDWTENLGEAFLADEEQVLGSIQNLRQQAYDAGTLEDMEHVSVTREERHIVIEPAVREVVYIPYYDTRVVYGSWWWDHHPPLHWHHHHHHHHSHWVHWGPRIHVSSSFFFSAFHWSHRRIVVIDHGYRHQHRFYRAHHVARHRHARHWQHNPQHRRGVVYRNPRTRDYFERQHRARGDERRSILKRASNDVGSRSTGSRSVDVQRRLAEPRQRATGAAKNVSRDRVERVKSADRNTRELQKATEQRLAEARQRSTSATRAATTRRDATSRANPAALEARNKHRDNVQLRNDVKLRENKASQRAQRAVRKASPSPAAAARAAASRPTISAPATRVQRNAPSVRQSGGARQSRMKAQRNSRNR